MTASKPFMFWEKDWYGDPDLMRCAPASRMIWLDCLVRFMRKNEGRLLINDRRPTDREIADAIFCKESDVAAALAELGANGVYSRTEEGVIYCRKLVRLAERVKRRTEQQEQEQMDLDVRKGAVGLLDAGAKEAEQRAKSAARARLYRARKHYDRETTVTPESVTRHAKRHAPSRSKRDASRDASVTQGVTQPAQVIEKGSKPRRVTPPPPLPESLSLSKESLSEAAASRPQRPPATLTGVGRSRSIQPETRSIQEQRDALRAFAEEEGARPAIVDINLRRGGHQ